MQHLRVLLFRQFISRLKSSMAFIYNLISQLKQKMVYSPYPPATMYNIGREPRSSGCEKTHVLKVVG